MLLRALRWLRDKTRALWYTAHLKSQGKYSVARLNALAQYLRHASFARTLLALLCTPLPALAMVVGSDAFKLAPPEEGSRANGLFWFRAWAVSTALIAILLLQLSIFVQDLHMKLRDIAAITLFSSTSGIFVAIGLASQIGFPLPFLITMVSPYTSTCICTCTALRYGRQLAQDQALRLQLVEFAVFLGLQYGVTIVYPIFAFIFTHVQSVALQTLLACLLPLTKLVFKVIMSRVMKSLPELRPAFIMFNVEVFNALFIACCLQNASSVVITIAIMALDLFHNTMTLRDVTSRLDAINKIFAASDTTTVTVDEPTTALGHESGDDFLGSLVDLLRNESISKALGASTASQQRLAQPAGFTQVVPCQPSQNTGMQWATRPASAASAVIPTGPARKRSRLDILDASQKVSLMRQVTELLYYTEYVVLTEYVEVVVPAIYAVFLAVVYELPNRVYYPQLRELSPAAHTSAIHRVLVYVLLESISFLAFEWILRRRLKLAPLRQLGFVLTDHWWFLPGKLMLWVTFIVQCSSLEHYGVDYSFQFAWLRAGSSDHSH